MAKQIPKLAALRMLGDLMKELEKQRQKRIDSGDEPADVDRETAQGALTGVMQFFLDHGIETMPLMRLLSELGAVTAGASPSKMLAPSASRHRRPVAPTIEAMKGRLAAIMEFRQAAGFPRKFAGEWVVRHVPAKMKRKLSLTSHETVSAWLVKWGGQRGAKPGPGRNGYLSMRGILQSKTPSETQLKAIIKVLARSPSF